MIHAQFCFFCSLLTTFQLFTYKTDRSSSRRCSVKKGVFCKFHKKTLVLDPLFDKVAAFQACNFIKKRLQHMCFPVKFVKFSRTSIWRTSANAASIDISLWKWQLSNNIIQRVSFSIRLVLTGIFSLYLRQGKTNIKYQKNSGHAERKPWTCF